MAAPKTRGDYDQLKQIAQRFGNEASHAQNTLQTLRQHVGTLQSGDWVGQGATAFYAEMNGDVLPSVQRLVHALQSAQRTTLAISSAIKQAEGEAAALLNGTGAASALVGAPSSALVGNAPTPSVASSASPTYDQYLKDAYAAAGIDPTKWDPSKGVAGNIENIQKVYDYYNKLFQAHPELQWAGMARYTALNTFYPAFMQVNALKTLLDDSSKKTEALALYSLLTGQPLTALMSGGAIVALARAKQDVAFLETKLLTMQKEIFTDIATQHEAYLRGGLPAIAQLKAEIKLDNDTFAAWQKIASGDPAEIAAGNAALLRREQRDILQRHYSDIRNYPAPGTGTDRGAEGRLMSVALSLMGTSPMPAPNSIGHFWDTVPGGDITKFEDRWKWAGGPMLSAYQKMLATDPTGTRNYLNTPLDAALQPRLEAQLNSLYDSKFVQDPLKTIPGPIDDWAVRKLMTEWWPDYVVKHKP